MRILTTLAAAAALTLAAASSAIACSYKNQVTAQTPMPQAAEQQQADAAPAVSPTTAPATVVTTERTMNPADVAQSSTGGSPDTSVQPN